MKNDVDVLEESTLIFGGKNEEKDPRLGLGTFGPFKYPTESGSAYRIRLGIIADSVTIDKAKEILKLLKQEVPSQNKNKWLDPPYPGMTDKTKFNAVIEQSQAWEQIIKNHEIEEILKIGNANERISKAAELYRAKVMNLTDYNDDPPDVILCCLPIAIEEHCGISEYTRGAKTPKPTKIELQLAELKEANQTFLSEWGLDTEEKTKNRPKSYDFRNALKGKIMNLNNPRPIQVLRESTMDAIANFKPGGKNSRQDPAAFAWNLSTAIYYKANGKPWRLARLRDDTCYVGISFYKDKLSFNKDMQTSMAQVFTNTGEGIVLRGTEVYVDERTHEAHLTEEQATRLLTDVIARYSQKSERPPSRVVIHKGTTFTKAEETGFRKAAEKMAIDFVAVAAHKSEVKLLRVGKYPVLRGTLLQLELGKYIFYTSGYTPRLRVYPGHRIPQPLLIKHKGDSSIKEICQEILGLSKLNWNTTAFSTYLPITLAFAGKVGRVLSELEDKNKLADHYRFYM